MTRMFLEGGPSVTEQVDGMRLGGPAPSAGDWLSPERALKTAFASLMTKSMYEDESHPDLGSASVCHVTHSLQPS